MSRLTIVNMVPGEYRCYDILAKVWGDGEVTLQNLSPLVDKLGRYEDLGEPEELSKVVPSIEMNLECAIASFESSLVEAEEYLKKLDESRVIVAKRMEAVRMAIVAMRKEVPNV